MKYLKAVLIVAAVLLISGQTARAQGYVFASSEGHEPAVITAVRNADDPAGVVEAYSRGLETHEHDPRLHEAYIRRMIDLGLAELTYYQAQELVGMDPYSGIGWAVIAQMNLLGGNGEGAVAAIHSAIRHGPDEPFALKTAGEIVAWIEANTGSLEVTSEMVGRAAELKHRLQYRREFHEPYEIALDAYLRGPDQAPSDPWPDVADTRTVYVDHHHHHHHHHSTYYPVWVPSRICYDYYTFPFCSRVVLLCPPVARSVVVVRPRRWSFSVHFGIGISSSTTIVRRTTLDAGVRLKREVPLVRRTRSLPSRRSTVRRPSHTRPRSVTTRSPRRTTLRESISSLDSRPSRDRGRTTTDRDRSFTTDRSGPRRESRDARFETTRDRPRVRITPDTSSGRNSRTRTGTTGGFTTSTRPDISGRDFSSPRTFEDRSPSGRGESRRSDGGFVRQRSMESRRDRSSFGGRETGTVHRRRTERSDSGSLFGDVRTRTPERSTSRRDRFDRSDFGADRFDRSDFGTDRFDRTNRRTGRFDRGGNDTERGGGNVNRRGDSSDRGRRGESRRGR